MSFTDKELVALQPQLLAFCRWLLSKSNKPNKRDKAEELCQDTLEKALRNRHRFDGKKLKSWLFKIARNTNFSQTSRDWRGDTVEPTILEAVISKRIGYTEPDALTRIEVKEAVLATAFLSAIKRDALFAALEDMTYAEIGEQQGIPKGTVKTRVKYARADLTGIIDDFGTAGTGLSILHSITPAHIELIKNSLAAVAPPEQALV